MVSYEELMKRRADRAAEKLKQKTTVSKARKGFPVMFRSGDLKLLQMAHSWLKLRNRTTPQMDETIKLFPDPEPTDGYFSKTTRIRGDQIEGVIALLQAVSPFPGINVSGRICDLKKITAMDAMVDVGR